MALFGNQNKKTIEELENYYAGKQQRSGMAWVMALLSLILTVAVLGGLFFGGRWVYRTLTNDDTDTAEIVSTSDPTSNNVSSGSSSDDSDADDRDDPNDASDNQDATISGGVVSDEAARTDVPSTADNDDMSNDTVAGTDSADNEADDDDEVAAATSDNEQDILPDTGADTSVLFAITAVTLVGGYLAARHKQLQ